jgi:hypothetical protein
VALWALGYVSAYVRVRKWGCGSGRSLTAPIAFLNDELKAELGMNTKMDDEEDDTIFLSLKVPIDPTDKDSKIYIVKIHKYDT